MCLGYFPEVTMAGPVDVDAFQDVQIFDENGMNVTPKSLAHLALGGAGNGLVGITGTSTVPSDALKPISDAGVDVSTQEVVLDPELLGDAHDEEDASNESSQKPKKSDDPELEIQLTLSEPDTFTLFKAPGRCIKHDDPIAGGITNRNETYTQLLKKKVGSELYVDASSQTIQNIKKEKENQSALYVQSEQASQSSQWDIYDNTGDAGNDEGLLKSHSIGTGTDDLNAAGMSTRRTSTYQSTSSEHVNLERLNPGARRVEKALLQNLYQDRMLLYRNYRVEDAVVGVDAVGGVTDTPTDLGKETKDDSTDDATDASADKKENPTEPPPKETFSSKSIVHLWDFVCPVTAGRTVSCVAWNKSAPDVLAVGYGELDFMTRDEDEDDNDKNCSKGLVAFWSLKNPEFPEWFFQTEHGVTALDFSPTEFNLLAVGLRDGTVGVYNTREPSQFATPFLNSGDGVPGKHTDPVWKLKWVQRGVSGEGSDEVLVSISSDGRVTSWRLKKGLEFLDLMRLTRVAKRSTIGGGGNGDGKNPSTTSEAYISRTGSGLCFDFSPSDCTSYIAGTEDGMLHKCSSAYSDTYLRDFHGHAGPVHTVQWSPFASDVFVSASADWTLKLWHAGDSNCVLTLLSRSESVADVCWSPSNATVLASGSADGGVDVWDLATSTLKPVFSATTSSKKVTCVSFSEVSPVLVTGGAGGAVGVYRLVGVQEGARDEVKRLRAALGGSS